MRHPRSRCTFAFETMAHRKKQVWQPGGGPTGATCCGALLIIPSAFLSFSFRLPPSSLASSASSFCSSFFLLFIFEVPLLPRIHSLPLYLSFFEPFPSPGPCRPFSSPQVAATSAQRMSSFISTSAFYCCETMSFKCLGARDVLSLSLVKGRSIKRASTEMLHRAWCKAIKLALNLWWKKKNLVRVRLWLHSVQGICIWSSLENIGRKLVSSHTLECYYRPIYQLYQGLLIGYQST